MLLQYSVRIMTEFQKEMNVLAEKLRFVLSRRSRHWTAPSSGRLARAMA
jgi:hypothetical protein